MKNNPAVDGCLPAMVGCASVPIYFCGLLILLWSDNHLMLLMLLLVPPLVGVLFVFSAIAGIITGAITLAVLSLLIDLQASNRTLLVSGIVLAGLVVICSGGTLLFLHGSTRANPYPAFMEDYVQMTRSDPTYQGAKRKFTEFVVKTFPIGSNANDAIAQASRGGFRQIKSTSHSVTLGWTRPAGVCGESYVITIDQNADGTIAKATGHLHTICF